jgi:hypothetical protein
MAWTLKKSHMLLLLLLGCGAPAKLQQQTTMMQRVTATWMLA